MPIKRTGNPSLAYMGVESSTPPQLTVVNRAPTANDYSGYVIGHIWIFDGGIAGAEEVWILVDKRAKVATWIQFNQGGGVPTFPCDVGQAVSVGGVTNVFGAWNINTLGLGNTVDIYLDTSIHQPLTNAAGDEGVYYLGSVDGVGGNTFMHAIGTQNTFVGQSSGNLALNTGNARRNVGVGYQTLVTNVDGENNVAVGESALATLATGDRNVAVGHGNSDQATDIDYNTSVGGDGLTQLLTGDYNSTLGYRSGFNYVAAESSNILIGNEGILGDNNTIRIGEQGAGAGQQDECFIAGIHGVAVGGVNEIVYIDNDGQLGSTAGTDGQLLIAATGASPLWRPLVSGDGTVLITLGANSIDLRSAGGGAGGATTFVTDVAGPAVILGNLINMAGDGIIQTDGTVANTVTFQLPDGANGELLIGGGAAAPVWGNLTAGVGINIVNAANSITISAPGAGGGATTFNTDVAGPAAVVGGNIDIFGGANITTTGGGQTVTVDLDDSIALPDTNAAGTTGVIKLASGTTFMHNRGAAGTSYNTFLGQDAGNLTLTTAVDDTGIGYESLNSLTTGDSNTMVGSGSGKDETTGSNNSGLGMDVLFQINTATNNSALGFEAFNGIVTGSSNIGIGYQAGFNCTAGDSSNILIGNTGASGLNNTIKIGTDGSGVGQQDTTFIHGIYGVAPPGGAIRRVTIDALGQLGTTTDAGDVTDVNGGTNITTVNPGGPVVTVNLDDNVILAGNLTAVDGTFSGTMQSADATVTNLGRGVVQSSAGGVLSSSEGTDGQVMISSSTGAPAWSTLTAGTNVTITNAANSITINSTGGVASGSVWISRTTAFPTGSAVDYSFSGIVGNGSTWVVVGNRGKIRYTTNIANAYTDLTVGTGTYTDITYGGGYYVAVGGTGSRIAYAANAAGPWTVLAAASAFNYKVIYDGTNFVVTGSAGVYYAANPAGPWVISAGSSTGYNSIAYGGGYYVLTSVSNSNYTYTNSLAVPWTIVTNAKLFGVSGIAYGSGQFVASAYSTASVPKYGLIYILSAPGAAWQIKPMGEDIYNNISFGNGTFVITGNEGLIETSTIPAGVWTRIINSAYNKKFLASSYANGVFAAVASGIVTSSS